MNKSNEGGHSNDDRKTIDLSAELKATTARRRLRVSRGPGEPRSRRHTPLAGGHRRPGQRYCHEMKQDIPYNRRTPIRRVPISRTNPRRGIKRIPRTRVGSKSKSPKTEFIKLGSIDSIRSSSDNVEKEAVGHLSDELEQISGSRPSRRNNAQIDSDFAFAVQLQMSETEEHNSSPGHHAAADYQPSTSLNVQIFSNDIGRGQNNSVSMVHSTSGTDGTSTTIRVNQGRPRSSTAPVLTPPNSSQIQMDAEYAMRILESDFQDSEDTQDGQPVSAFQMNTNHRFSSDEALARRIQEELWQPERPLRLSPPQHHRRGDIDEDDISEWSDGYQGPPVYHGYPGPVAGRRLRPIPAPFFSDRFRGSPFINVDTMDHDDLLQLQERIGHVSRGAQQSTINELPTRKFVQKRKSIDEKTSEDDSKEAESNAMSCCICMNTFKTADDVRTLPCLHIYHTKCIDKWLVRNRTCPICKFDITKNSIT